MGHEVSKSALVPLTCFRSWVYWPNHFSEHGEEFSFPGTGPYGDKVALIRVSHVCWSESARELSEPRVENESKDPNPKMSQKMQTHAC